MENEIAMQKEEDYNLTKQVIKILIVEEENEEEIIDIFQNLDIHRERMQVNISKDYLLI